LRGWSCNARQPEWLEDARGYAVLAECLARRGFGDEELAKILGGNMERVFRAATAPAPPAKAVAASLRSAGL